MTAAALAHLPLAAGSVVLASTGRATLWAAARYMRAPAANTAVLALLTFGAMAGSNALYMQESEHPAPLFAPGEIRQAAVEPMPVMPAMRSKPQDVVVLAPVASETTGSVEAGAKADPIGNAEVTEIQRKLKEMDLYTGSVDGLYGPRTARAIKEFEERTGLKPKGELSRDLLEAVRKAPAAAPAIAPLPEPDPLPEVSLPSIKPEPRAVAEPAAAAPSADVVERAIAVAAAESVLEPLAEPEPLVIEAAVAERPRARRELPKTPQEAMNIAVETAGEAIDTIIDGVQSLAMTTPGNKAAVETASFAPAENADEPAIRTASINAPKVGVPLENPDAVVPDKPPAEIAVLEGETKPEELNPALSVNDPVVVAKVQLGLASLGFLHGPADGIAGEATAKAIRNFEVYYNYRVTGRISPELLDLLVQNGASI